jgi:hypothetical protein
MSKEWTRLATKEGIDVPTDSEVCLFDRRNSPRFYIKDKRSFLVRWLTQEEEEKLVKYLNWQV